MCKQVGIGWDDMENMTIGMCIDFIDEYVEQKNPKKTKVRQAEQSDFDSF